MRTHLSEIKSYKIILPKHKSDFNVVKEILILCFLNSMFKIIVRQFDEIQSNGTFIFLNMNFGTHISDNRYHFE